MVTISGVLRVQITVRIMYQILRPFATAIYAQGSHRPFFLRNGYSEKAPNQKNHKS